MADMDKLRKEIRAQLVKTYETLNTACEENVFKWRIASDETQKVDPTISHGSAGVAFCLYKYCLLLKSEKSEQFEKVYS